MKIGDKIVPYAGNYSRQNRGRIFSLPECGSDAEEYGNIRGFYKCQAMLYGTTTMLEGYSNGLAVDLPKADKQYPKKDYIAKSEVENYIIALPQCALTEAVSEDHLVYLQGLGISYIFA
ncbi:MAG: hypothetical protein K2J73_11925 [Oscillospiraceae bacterium]|nr:hypothetical protein [Oscillospiraceae bacterium]